MKELQNRTLFYGDNLEILREKFPGDEGYFDLIYLDPPFNSNRSYNVIFKEGFVDSSAQSHAFEDSWHWSNDAEHIFNELIGVKPSQTKINQSISDLMQAFEKMVGKNDMLAYLTMMTIRLIELKRVLKSTGSIYLHCDSTASHYLKIMMDAIFGKENFRNEIIWERGTASGGKAGGDKFVPNHDIIFCYNKEVNKAFYVRQYITYTKDYIEQRFKYTDESGRRYRLQLANRKQYLDESKGKPVSDIWTDIFPINPMAKEKLGYPTQKPEALLERIIKASSKEDDWILDPFCGCGTTVAVAEKLNRNWIGIDISSLAIKVIKDRLSQQFRGKALIQKIRVDGLPKDLNGANLLFQKSPWDFEYWSLLLVDGAIPAKNKSKENMKGADKGIDGVITFLKNTETNDYGKVIIQVKGGHVQRNQIATLKGDVEREKADGGLFITLEKPTKPMVEEAITAGYYKTSFSVKEFPKIQILTIDELLNGKQPDLPYGLVKNHFKEAQEIQENLTQELDL